MDTGVRCHGMKANHTGYLWSKYEYLMIKWYKIWTYEKPMVVWRKQERNADDRGKYSAVVQSSAKRNKMTTKTDCIATPTFERLYQHDQVSRF